MFSNWFSRKSTPSDEEVASQFEELKDLVIKSRNNSLERNKLEEKIEELKDKLDNLDSSYQRKSSENNRLLEANAMYHSELSKYKVENKSLNRQVEDLENHINELNEEIDDLRATATTNDLVHLDVNEHLMEDIELAKARLGRYEDISSFQLNENNSSPLYLERHLLDIRCSLAHHEDEHYFYMYNALEHMTVDQLKRATTKLDSNSKQNKCAYKSRVIDTISRKAQSEGNTDSCEFMLEDRHKLNKQARDYMNNRLDQIQYEWDRIFSLEPINIEE